MAVTQRERGIIQAKDERYGHSPSSEWVEWPHPGRDPTRAANGLRGGPMRDFHGADSKAMRSLAGTLW